MFHLHNPSFRVVSAFVLLIRGVLALGRIWRSGDQVWEGGVWIPEDNGPEFTSETVRAWVSKTEVMILHIGPGSPGQKGYRILQG